MTSRVLDELDEADLAPTAAIDFLSAGGRDSIEILAGCIKGLAHFHLGESAEAVAALEAACAMPGMQHPMWRMNTLGALALVRAWTGHLDDAQRLASSAVAFAVELGVQRHVALSSARLALGLVAIERNAPLESAKYLGAAGNPTFPVRGSTDLDTRSYLLARLASLRDGPDAALALLDEPMLGAEPPPILRQARRALRARQQLATGDVFSARITLGSGCPDRLVDPVRFDLEMAAGDRSAAGWSWSVGVPMSTTCSTGSNTGSATRCSSTPKASRRRRRRPCWGSWRRLSPKGSSARSSSAPLRSNCSSARDGAGRDRSSDG
ncbi:MAG: hypothetical protein M5U19_02495 [Microthrixaceae bacterium]|nr:hypothetical protein [Microthrixaceae bacterium]